jgi:hypothetical protein
MCEGCRQQFSTELSAKSRQRVQGLMEEEVDWDGRLERIAAARDLGPWIDHCLFCHAPRDEQSGYALSGIFAAGRLLPGPLPAIICAACAGRIQQQMSRQTRDFWDRFSREHFPGPPADLVDVPAPHWPAIF